MLELCKTNDFLLALNRYCNWFIDENYIGSTRYISRIPKSEAGKLDSFQIHAVK